MPGTAPSKIHRLIELIPSAALRDRGHYYAHFTGEKLRGRLFKDLTFIFPSALFHHKLVNSALYHFLSWFLKSFLSKVLPFANLNPVQSELPHPPARL